MSQKPDTTGPLPPDEGTQPNGSWEAAYKPTLDGPNSSLRGDTIPSFGPPKKEGDLGSLGKYRILKKLGGGGMGGIYLGFDERLRRRAAIKILLPELANRKEAKERFQREAMAAAQLHHPNIVVIYDDGEENGVLYMAMEYLQGSSLDDYLKKNTVSGISQTLRVGREICSALALAHRMGAAHRDIKPSNIWLEVPYGHVKVLDFGLVKWLSPQDEARLTSTGAIIGSPAYMSPEQARGHKVDHRTDLFSLGVLLYRMVGGRQPFQGENLMDLLVALGSEEPTPIRTLNPRVPAGLAELIHQLLQKDPAKRPQSTDQVLARLSALAEERGTMGAAGVGSQTVSQSATTRKAVPTNQTATAERILAPIPISPQDERAFDAIDPPMSFSPTVPPAHEITIPNRSQTTAETPTLPRKKTTNNPWQNNPIIICAGLSLIFIGVFCVTLLIRYLLN